jgi:predicted permease
VAYVEGAPNPQRQDGRRNIYFNVVGGGYFETMGIPVVRGREFGAADREGAPGTVVVNQTLAARMWPGADPIGKRLSFAGASGPWLTVVGVARDAKYNSLGEETPPYMYLAQAQNDRRQLVLHARAAPGAEASVAAGLRRLVAELDPLVPPPVPAPLASDMGIALLPAQLGAGLLGAFGALALLLASVGIYGVTSYAVAQRTREIGIRSALGAARRDVVALVLGQTGRLVVGGLAAGLVLAVGLSRLLQSQLYGVGAGDPATFVATPLVLLGVAVLAVLVPARRATRVDPVVALREE